MAQRAKIASREYLTADGNAGRSVPDGCVGLHFKFENAEQLEVVLSDLPQPIQDQLAYHGLSQKIGDAFAGAKGDVNLAQENAESLWEQLMGGTWSEKASGVGAKPSMVADAVIAAIMAEGGKVDATRESDIREKVKDKATKDGALADPAIKAQWERIRSERAAERATKAATVAEGAESTASTMF